MRNLNTVEHYLWKAYPYKLGIQVFQTDSTETTVSSKKWLYDKFINHLKPDIHQSTQTLVTCLKTPDISILKRKDI